MGIHSRDTKNEINEDGFGAFKYSYTKPEALIKRILSTLCGTNNLPDKNIDDMTGCFKNTGTFDVRQYLFKFALIYPKVDDPRVMLERYGEIKNQDIQLVECGDKDVQDDSESSSSHDEQGYLRLLNSWW